MEAEMGRTHSITGWTLSRLETAGDLTGADKQR